MQADVSEYVRERLLITPGPLRRNGEHCTTIGLATRMLQCEAAPAGSLGVPVGLPARTVNLQIFLRFSAGNSAPRCGLLRCNGLATNFAAQNECVSVRGRR